MRPYLAILLSIAFGVAPKANAIDTCSNGGTGLQQLQCQTNALNVADRELNFVYHKLLAILPEQSYDEPTKKMLITSQRAWLSYRDKTCEFEGYAEGGLPQYKATFKLVCQIKLTKERIAWLKNKL